MIAVARSVPALSNGEKPARAIARIGDGESVRARRKGADVFVWRYVGNRKARYSGDQPSERDWVIPAALWPGFGSGNAAHDQMCFLRFFFQSRMMPHEVYADSPFFSEFDFLFEAIRQAVAAVIDPAVPHPDDGCYLGRLGAIWPPLEPDVARQTALSVLG